MTPYHCALANSRCKVKRWDQCQACFDYQAGCYSANYPVPCTEYVNALAMSPDRVSFYTKLLLLRAGEFTLKHSR